MDKNLTLYGASAELAELEKTLEVVEDSESAEIVAERINQLTTFLNEKTDLCVGYNSSLDDYINICDLRIKELTALKKSLEKKQDNYHDYILRALDLLGVKKITGRIYSISYRAPSTVVEITNESEIPMEFTRTKTTVEVDKTSIKDALKAGQTISGAVLKEGKRSLTFKAGK